MFLWYHRPPPVHKILIKVCITLLLVALQEKVGFYVEFPNSFPKLHYLDVMHKHGLQVVSLVREILKLDTPWRQYMELLYLFVALSDISAGRHREPVIPKVAHVEHRSEICVDVLR